MARLLALCSHVGVRKWAEQIGRHSLNPPPFQLVPVPQISLTVEPGNDGLRLSGLLGGGRGASSTPPPFHGAKIRRCGNRQTAILPSLCT